MIVEGVGRAGGLSPAGYLLALASAAPLAWRTSAPLSALVGVEAGALASAAALDASWTATALVLLELYTISLLGDRRRSLMVGWLTAIGVVLAIVLFEGAVELTGVVLRVVLVFAAVALGDTVRARVALRDAAREREERAEREREEHRRRRAADERRRMAQELHDTLAHSLVAINVRAGVAVDLPDAQDPHVALREIKQVSAAALQDLRATLGLLREPEDVAPTAPSPDLEALPDLVGQVNAAGLRADLSLDVNGRPIPSAIGAAAFRIVQEALTNVLRHADASCAHVSVRASPDVLEIEISDDGRAQATATDAGLGLPGMIERSAALGGRLDAGPRREGGWRVHAKLPLNGGVRP